jgi:hypothetical protein
MKLQPVEISDRGVANKERLWLKVLVNTNLKFFMAFVAVRLPNKLVSRETRGAYWFADKEVRAGDQVILYTAKGTPSQMVNPDGSTTHFLFWGSESTLWNAPTDCALLIEIEEWNTIP